MTTIITKLNDNGTVDIAWDSQSTAGNKMRHSEKVMFQNDQFYIGCAGDARWGDIIQTADLDPAHPADFESDDFDVYLYLARHAVPTWIKALREAEHIHLDKDEWAGGAAILVMKGRVFEMDGSYSLNEILTYGGVGSGSGYATGAMAHGASVVEALAIAAELDPFTGGELHKKMGV